MQDYYLNFIPYFAVLFSPLFTFISVIYFTSRMAYNSEIIAILSSGVSFKENTDTYFISAFALPCLPSHSQLCYSACQCRKLAFEELYYHKLPKVFRKEYSQADRAWHLCLPGKFQHHDQQREKVLHGEIPGREAYIQAVADEIRWDSTKNKWHIRNIISGISRGFSNPHRGRQADTTLALSLKKFRRRTTPSRP